MRVCGCVRVFPPIYSRRQASRIAHKATEIRGKERSGYSYVDRATQHETLLGRVYLSASMEARRESF